jgi:ABC-type multidrug transport system ATPase subunit
VIRLSDVSAHAAPYSLSNVTIDLDAGLHALIGTPIDGVALVLAVAAGWIRPRKGKVTVLGSAPELARRQIAYVPLDARLPTALRVEEALEVAASIRGERGDAARHRLASMGIEPLADRWTQSLSPPETRAVLVTEAVTSNAGVLLIDEPRVDLDPRAARALPAKLRERAAAGATVVIATSSPRDALDLTTQQWVFSLGRLLGGARGTDVLVLSAGNKPRMRVVASDGKALLSALASEPALSCIELDHDALVLLGQDPRAMAESVARAALAAGVELEAMHLDAPALDELRSAAARKWSLLPPAAARGSLPPSGGTA